MTVAQRTRAADIITRKGQTVTIAGATGSTYAPATGTTTPVSYSKTAKAVILPLSEYRKAANANIVAGDEQMLIAGLDTSGAALPEPPVNAVVTLADSSARTLVEVSKLNPDGAGIILFDCVVRGQQ